MAVLSEHHVAITIDHEPQPMRLDVTSLRIAMDEEWIPYVQASAVCPLGDGEVARLDPQASDLWATITVRRALGRIDRLSDLSRRYRGRTLAAITAAFRGGTVADITRSLYHDYAEPGHPRREETRAWRVMLRGVETDRKAGTVILTFASGEARLEDWLQMASNPIRVGGADLKAKLDQTLALAGFPEGVTFAPTSVPTDAQIGDEAVRVPASSALDFVNALTRQHDLMLWCDENGLWNLAQDRTKPGTRALQSAGPDRSVINEVSKRSRDENWITAVMVIYTWQGADHYDIYSPWAPNPERALIRRYNRPYPGPGLAANIFRQVAGRGRALELLAVSTYEASPGETVVYTTPREKVTGRLAAIEWQFPGDQMSIRLREVGAA